MTSIVKRMSINYYLEQRKKNENDQVNNLPKRENLYKSDILTEEMINVLNYLGKFL